MDDEIVNREKIIQYWVLSSGRNYSTMQNLLKTEDNDWALFLGHLVLEKLLKANYVKRMGTHAIFTHDLIRLSKKMKLELTDEYEDWLDDITTFNLNARYDSYKQDFKALCTKAFTDSWIIRIEILRLWLIKEL